MSVSSDSKRIIKAILIGILSACLITALLTCIVAFILKMTSGIPYGIIDYIMVAIEGLGVFIGAYIACMITKSKGLLMFQHRILIQINKIQTVNMLLNSIYTL